MRWSLVIASAALLATAQAAQAQTARPANNEPVRVPGYLISQGNEAATSYVSAAPPVPLPSAPQPPAPANVLPPTPFNAAPAATLAPPAPVADAGFAAPDVGSWTPQMIGGDLGVPAGALLRLDTGGRVPLVTRGAYKIDENESPRPHDRVFLTFNYFNNVHVLGTAPSETRQFDVYRETFGFEKTFLDGDASIGIRAPVIQKEGLSGPNIDGFGDVTIVTKYAFVNNRETGDVLAGGVVVTVPNTTRVILSNDANVLSDRLQAWLIQPWAGFVVNSDRLFVHGFTALIISSEQRDATVVTADVGVGYKVDVASHYSIVTQVIPTLEFHANVPLNHNGADSSTLIVFPDQFVLTGGVHLGLGSHALLTVGASLPISGPKVYDFGLLCQLNVRF